MTKLFGGSSSSNDALIEQQKREAAEAERKEQERQNQLAYGREKINAMFSTDGGTISGPQEWGVTGQQQIGSTPTMASQRVRNPSAERPNMWTSNSFVNVPYQTGSTPIYKDVEGWVSGPEETVQGLGDQFYTDYKDSILGYYQPEVAKQFEDAQSANLFDLARRGTLRSSQAADNAAELLEEKAIADARVTSNAENQTAGLRTDMSRAQQNALSLLQATEDPTTAANTAATEVNAIQSRSPTFDPLGEMFSAAARGYAGYQQGVDNRKWQSAIPTKNPYTSSGRNIG